MHICCQHLSMWQRLKSRIPPPLWLDLKPRLKSAAMSSSAISTKLRNKLSNSVHVASRWKSEKMTGKTPRPFPLVTHILIASHLKWIGYRALQPAAMTTNPWPTAPIDGSNCQNPGSESEVNVSSDHCCCLFAVCSSGWPKPLPLECHVLNARHHLVLTFFGRFASLEPNFMKHWKERQHGKKMEITICHR